MKRVNKLDEADINTLTEVNRHIFTDVLRWSVFGVEMHLSLQDIILYYETNLYE